jgi:transcriptional regulator with XRE-family HTH domain
MLCPKCGGYGYLIKGIILRRMRLAIPFTLKRISEEIGYTVSYLSDIERGKRNVTPEIYKMYQKINEREINQLKGG